MKFNNNTMLEGFCHIQVSNLSKLIVISISKNGIVFSACSKVNLILGCWVLSFSRNLVHDWSSLNIAKMSAIYLRCNLGDDFETDHNLVRRWRKFYLLNPKFDKRLTGNRFYYQAGC